MPLELVAVQPKQIGYREYDEREPLDGEVLVQTTVSGVKHGTELNQYRGTNPFIDEIFDPVLRVFRAPRDGELVKPSYPMPLGSWAAGVVRAVGPAVTQFKAGDLVHGQWLHRQSMIRREHELYPVPTGMDAETMLFSDPARFALGAIHDAEIKLGDRVAIFGLGAIGLLALQMARLSGAGQIIVVDVIPARLALAKHLGADLAIHAAEQDAGLAIKDATGNAGADVAIEISGAYAALQQAIRCVQREGLVVSVSSFGDPRGHIDLSREWHHNRVELRSSMPVWGCGHRQQPLWDHTRLTRTAIRLLEDQKLVVHPLISARVPFEQAADAYRVIDQAPHERIKTVLTYDATSPKSTSALSR